MIITCETCGTRFKVKSSLIRPAGSTVRCSKCQHVFVAYPSLPKPEFEQSFEKKEKPPSSEADFSSLGTSTFLADAAETEKQLDAFFAEDPESGGDVDFSDTALDAGQGPEADSEAPSSGRQQLFESPRAAGTDFKGIESAGAGQSDSLELDFLNLSEGRSQEIFMGDLEFDSELRFSDLEPDADLELSDLEPDADPGFSGLEAATDQGLMDSRPDAELDLSDLEPDADLDFPDLEAEMDTDFLETEPGMDLDFSDLESETEEAFQTGAAGREQAFSEPEPDADLELSDLEQDADLELSDLEENTDADLDLSDLEEDTDADLELPDLEEDTEEDLPDSGSDADLEISEPEPDADLNLSELVKQPETESEVEYEEIQPADEAITELSDSQQREESDPEFAATEQAEETASVDTVEEEFDLDLDTFELNLEDENGFSQDAYSTGEAPGKTAAKTEISEMEKDEETPGKTEEELFDLELDLDFEESDDTDSEPVATETQIPGSDAEEKPDAAEGAYEVNLDLGDAEKEDDDFLLDLDLDFDETPEQESPRAEPAGEQEELDFDRATFETLPDDQEAGADLELDQEPRQEASSASGRADDTADAPEPGDQEESVEITEFDLELETSVDTGSVATEDEDFELDLETMFEEGDESEAEKDASLEPVDAFAGRSAAREDQKVEVFDQDFAAQEEPVVFSGVTDEPADKDGLEQARAPEELFEKKAAGFAEAGPQPGKVRKKTVWPILVLILVLAAAAAVGAYAYFYGFGAKKSVGFDAGNRKIAVSDPSYQFIDNQNAGELLVVAGSVTNRYDHARQNIRVESGLHDAQGRQMAKSVAICGNTLGQEQLQRLEIGEIQQTLGRRAAQGHQRPVVRPGGSLPFMAVFSNPPGGIDELTVNVLSSEASQ